MTAIFSFHLSIKLPYRCCIFLKMHHNKLVQNAIVRCASVAPTWKLKYSHDFSLSSEGVAKFYNHKKRLKKYSFMHMLIVFLK